MKSISATIFFFLLSLTSIAQRLDWENIFQFRNDDYFFGVVPGSTGQYLAVGTSHKFGTRDGQTLVYGAVLGILNSAGDTVLLKSINGLYGGAADICRGQRDTSYVFIVGDFIDRGYYLAKILDNGQIPQIIRLRLLDNGGAYTHIIKLPDNSILMTGWEYNDRNASGQRMSVSRILPNGLKLFEKAYYENPGKTIGVYGEETPNGTYLTSGFGGSRIWANEIDDTGGIVQQRVLYQNLMRFNYIDATVKRAPNNRLIVHGTYYGRVGGADVTKFYFGSHDANTGARIWGGEKVGRMIAPQVLSDGSILFSYLDVTANWMSRIDADSNPIWKSRFQIPIPRYAIGPTIRDFCYNTDSSVVAVGDYTDAASIFNIDFYAARIANVGVPYDPTTPVGTRPQLGSMGGVVVWPQPSGGVVHFGGFVGPATVVLYDMKGKRVLLPTAVLPRQPLSIAHLPKGLYAYRLVAKDRVWTGKVVRE